MKTHASVLIQGFACTLALKQDGGGFCADCCNVQLLDFLSCWACTLHHSREPGAHRKARCSFYTATSGGRVKAPGNAI
jgi:hypothetical protein